MKVRIVIVASLIMILSAEVVTAQHTAEEAIVEAIELLKSKRQLVPTGDALQIDSAAERLRELADATDKPHIARRIAGGPRDRLPTSINVTDFIDHTVQYKGQVISLPLSVRSTALIRNRLTLRDLVGRSARFVGTAEDGNRLDLIIEIPAGMDVPKAFFGDRVIVTFQCKGGQLQRGNVAVTVVRPPQ